MFFYENIFSVNICDVCCFLQVVGLCPLGCFFTGFLKPCKPF